MNMENKVTKILKAYLEAIGIEDATIATSVDSMGFLLVVSIPKKNNEKIGILKGKKGRNLTILKQMLRVVGFTEHINPFLIIKLDEE